MKPNDQWCVHNNSFLCCTENISVTTGMSLSTTLTGNGIFYTSIKNDSNTDGIIWLTVYGGIIEKPLKQHKDFRVHSGLFLAMPQNIYDKIKVSLASSIFSTIAGGQGIFMDFNETEPTENDILYLQSGNFDEFLKLITPPIENKNSLFGFSLFGNSESEQTGGGGRSKKRKNTIKKRRVNKKHITRRV